MEIVTYILNEILKYIFPINHKYKKLLHSIDAPVCINETINNLNIVALHRYSKDIRKAILLLKYKKFSELEDVFANQVYEYIKSELNSIYMWNEPKNIYITFVPAHKARVHSKGYDHMRDLVKKIQIKLRKDFNNINEHIEMFKRIKNTKPQYPLSKQERIENMKNAFTLIQKPKRKSIVFVIDDICTTGTTLREINGILCNGSIDMRFVVLARKFF